MFTHNIAAISIIILAYLFGSVSSAVIVCRLMGLPDPRTEGSRNPGATNVLRLGGKVPAIITIVGDVLKGVIPVLIAKSLGFSPYVLGFTAFAAFFGHLYPIFFDFVGGKGVATLMGALFALSVPTGISFIVIWLIVIAITRYVSVGSMVAALSTPLTIWYFTGELHYVDITLIMAIIVIYRHRTNIAKIRQGTESKIKLRKGG